MIKLKDIIPEYNLEEDENPCWKGYEMVGMKEKDGRQVPNCVPIKEEKLTEAKVGSIFNMKKQIADGSFEPDNPEVLIKGFGRLPLKDLEKKVNRDLTDLAKRAGNGGESNFKGIINLLTKNDYVVDQAQAVVDVYEELKSSQVKRAITNYKKKR